MPTRITGLKGYLAEAVVEQWLRLKYPLPQFEIVSQIIPSGVPKKGGAYLDFGVIQGGLVKEVYEVKGQDYIFGKSEEANKALMHIWTEGNRIKSFETQDGRTFEAALDAAGFLILLAPPNDHWIAKISEPKLRFVKLFQDIWEEINAKDEEKAVAAIKANFELDFAEVMSILKQPTQGKSLLKPFLEKRNKFIDG